MKEQFGIHYFCVLEDLQTKLSPPFLSTKTIELALAEKKISKSHHIHCKMQQRQDYSETTHSNHCAQFVWLLKKCAIEKNLHKGCAVHKEILSEGLLEGNAYIRCSLVNMYAKCGALTKAREVFDQIQNRDIAVWNAMISCYAQNGYGEEALNCLQQMELEAQTPNEITFVCLLKACASIGAVQQGEDLHDRIVRDELHKKNIVVGTALVDMYAKFGALSRAQELFDELPIRSVISWNALIAGYAQYGYSEEALKCYEQLQREGFTPSAVTYVCVLKACGNVKALTQGQELHAKIIAEGLLGRNLLIGTTLVNMYAKCGALEKAKEVLYELPIRDKASWSALIAGYSEYGFGEEALNCFEQMRAENIHTDEIIYICILKACGSIGSATMGQEIHCYVVKQGFETDLIVGNSLLDMYSSCGMIAEAQELFVKMTHCDIVTWNALMAGYAQLGRHDFVTKLLIEMIHSGTDPDEVTFTILLNTCSHLGLLDEGEMWFEALAKHYCITPSLEHYSCMISLYGRSGVVEKVESVINAMPFPANLAIWYSVMGACQKWGNVMLGKEAFKNALQIDEKAAAVYICMNNLYVTADIEDYVTN